MSISQKKNKTGVLRTSVLHLNIRGLALVGAIFLLQSGLSGKPFSILEEKPHHCFFKRNSMMLGLGFGQSLVSDANGLNARVYYNIHERLCFGPEFAYRQASDHSSTDVNLVGHYIFDIRHFGFYPIIGASYTLEESHGRKEEGMGIVYGAGIHRNIRHLTLFGEYTRIEGAVQDELITLGAMYVFH